MPAELRKRLTLKNPVISAAIIERLGRDRAQRPRPKPKPPPPPKAKVVPRPQALAAMRRELIRRFPLCFAPDGHPKRPLKIGIRLDLFERCPDLSRDKLRA